MALPSDYTDDSGPQTPQNYKVTCMDFIRDISNDYKAWVDYYSLPKPEDIKRRTEIDNVVERTCKWIAKVPQTIKGIDVVMNDGIQKMAEATAGRPFQTGVFVNNAAAYVSASGAAVRFRLRAAGREERQTRIGSHAQDSRFRTEGTCSATVSLDSDDAYDSMDVTGTLSVGGGPGDIVSFTVIFCEVAGGTETDRRGVTTLVHLV